MIKERPSTSLAQITCALALFSLPVTSQATLIGHWTFDEGSGTTASDSSASGNDGVITDAMWGSDDGANENDRSSYLIFNGNTSLVDPSVTLPVMTNSIDFSWAAWVNSQAEISGTQQNAVIFGNRNDAAGADFVPRQFIKVTPTKFEWHQNGNGNDNLDVDDLAVDGWHHIAIVKAGIGLEYYFDGVSVGTTALTETIGVAENPFYIGGQANNTSINEYFTGFIDDVRIYDNALTAAEVLALFELKDSSPQGKIKFTEITVDADRNIDLTWTSRDLRTYSLEFSTHLKADGEPGGWQEIDDAIESGGDTTSQNLPADMFPFANTQEQLFFRVQEVERN